MLLINLLFIALVQIKKQIRRKRQNIAITLQINQQYINKMHSRKKLLRVLTLTIREQTAKLRVPTRQCSRLEWNVVMKWALALPKYGIYKIVVGMANPLPPPARHQAHLKAI